MTQEPVETTVTQWMCPVCLRRFDRRDLCTAHIRQEHPEPDPRALALVGSYIAFETLNRRYILRADRVPQSNQVAGPAMILGPNGRVEFEEFYWINIDRTEFGVHDEDGARAVWSGWCEELIRELPRRSQRAWETMQSRRPGQ